MWLPSRIGAGPVRLRLLVQEVPVLAPQPARSSRLVLLQMAAVMWMVEATDLIGYLEAAMLMVEAAARIEYLAVASLLAVAHKDTGLMEVIPLSC